METYSKIFLYIQILINTYSLAQAEVNLQTGGYVRHFIDYRVQWQKQEFVIERVYRSRSLFSGFFGLGWCSFLDEKLNFVNKDIEIDFCEDDTRLQLNGKGKGLWRSPRGKVIKTTNGFILEDDQKGKRFYNTQGWLIRIEKGIEIQRTPSGCPLEFSVASNHFKVQLDSSNSRINKISSNHLSTTEYKYSETQLKQIIQNKNLIQSYLYDEDANLIEIKSPTSTLEKITYEKNLDRVLEWHPQKDCGLTYQYDQLNSLETVTRILKTCKGSVTLIGEVHFYYESLSATEVQLVRYENQMRSLASDLNSISKRGRK